MDKNVTTLQIVIWSLLGLIGLWALITWNRMSWGRWWLQMRGEPPPANADQLPRAVGVRVLVLCLAMYGALLVFQRKVFLQPFWVFACISITIVMIWISTENMRRSINAHRKLYRYWTHREEGNAEVHKLTLGSTEDGNSG